MFFLIKRFISLKDNSSSNRNIYGIICGILGIFFNLCLFTAKLIVGSISGAISITADAFNNLSDATSSLVTLFGFILASGRADKEHPFGHGRIEDIAGIIVSVTIIVVGFDLLKSSIAKIITPKDIYFNKYVLIVLILSILTKLYMAHYNKKYGKQINSQTLIAAATDSRSDSIATLAVLVSAIFSHYTGIHVDGFIGAGVSLLIIWTGLKSVIDTASPLIGGVPDPEFVKRVEEIVNESRETVGIHDLVIHVYGASKKFVSLHMEVDGSKNIYALHDEVDLVERKIATELGCEAVIHMDPIDIYNPVLKDIVKMVKYEVFKIDERLSAHDIRIVTGTTHTNIIFDLLFPPELYAKTDDITKLLEERINTNDSTYYAIIKSDVSYCG